MVISDVVNEKEDGKSKNFEKREKGPEKNQVVYIIIIIIIIRVFISGDKT